MSEYRYCPACDRDMLERLSPNVKVADFRCHGCEELYQLRSQSKPLRARVVDSAYGPMQRAIRAGMVPSFLLMHYLREVWRVSNLLAIPGYFITESVIEERPPLAKAARRAGWVGCNLLLSRLPEDGRISVVASGDIVPKEDVRESWKRFAFLQGKPAETRGWTADVLACVRTFGKRAFMLEEMYGFERDLQALHPDNRHVKDKIRQQLQILRDHGVLRFGKRGTYELTR